MERVMNKKILKLLHRFLDEELGPKDREKLARHLEASAELRRTRDELLAFRRGIAEAGGAAFRPGFADRTVARLRATEKRVAAEARFIDIFPAVFKRFAVVAGMVLLAVMVYNAVHRDMIPAGAVYYISDLSLSHILRLPVF
jgi:anti-sigma factor RsiW